MLIDKIKELYDDQDLVLQTVTNTLDVMINVITEWEKELVKVSNTHHLGYESVMNIIHKARDTVRKIEDIMSVCCNYRIDTIEECIKTKNDAEILECFQRFIYEYENCISIVGTVHSDISIVYQGNSELLKVFGGKPEYAMGKMIDSLTNVHRSLNIYVEKLRDFLCEYFG